ncbi:MAG: hypothetical protein GY841_10320 [FCB group bacterium]|nr:hypothetical protein [FCB group bacterium]
METIGDGWAALFDGGDLNVALRSALLEVLNGNAKILERLDLMSAEQRNTNAIIARTIAGLRNDVNALDVRVSILEGRAERDGENGLRRENL